MKTSRVETYASDDCFRYFSFLRQQGEDESCKEASLEMVAGLSAFCGDWLVPLAVSLHVENRGPDDHFVFADDARPPARPFWFLRERGQRDELVPLRPFWRDAEERKVESLGAEELLVFVQESLDQPRTGELQTALSSLSVDALGIVIPEDVELDPKYAGQSITPVVANHRGRKMVLGPKLGYAGATPARLRAVDTYGTTTSIRFELCWDFWVEHPAGRAQLLSAVARLFARGRGWQLETGELPKL